MIKVDGVILAFLSWFLFLFSVVTLSLFIADIVSYRKFIQDNPELTEEERSKILNPWKMVVGIFLGIIVVVSSTYLFSKTSKILFEFGDMSGKIRRALRQEGELDRSVKEQILGWIADAENKGCYIEEK